MAVLAGIFARLCSSTAPYSRRNSNEELRRCSERASPTGQGPGYVVRSPMAVTLFIIAKAAAGEQLRVSGVLGREITVRVTLLGHASVLVEMAGVHTGLIMGEAHR